MGCEFCEPKATVDMPYRTNVNLPDEPKPIEPPKPKLTFDKRHPYAWGMIRWFVGLLAIAVGLGVVAVALWLLFPGVYHLGLWFSNSVMHWNIRSIHEDGAPPGGWFIGAGLIVAPFILFFSARAAGKKML